MLRSYLTSALLLASAAWAQNPQRAIVTITTSHGGAGNGLTNQTVTVPLNTPYRNTSALDAVSYLYLTGGTGVPFDSITCQAYQDADATETGGKPFDSRTPALLSTNTVTVGSILCTTNFVAMAPGGPEYSTSILATPTSSMGTSNLSMTARPSSRTSTPTGDAGGAVTSVFVTTMSATGGGGEEPTQSTVTSVFVPDEPTPTGGSEQGGQESQGAGGSATASASAGLSTPNLGTGVGREREAGAGLFGALALAWMGVAFVV